MSDPASDFLRRERITDALLEFERRLVGRMLPVGSNECWDVVLNRLPSHGTEPPGRAVPVPPLEYQTRMEVAVLRVVDPAAKNQACIGCDLFGRSHCGGGMVYLFYALRDTGVADPLSLLATEVEPGVFLPDWDRMADNSHRIIHSLRDFLETHLGDVSAEQDPGHPPFGQE